MLSYTQAEIETDKRDPAYCDGPESKIVAEMVTIDPSVVVIKANELTYLIDPNATCN